MHLLNTTCSWVTRTSFRSPNSRLQVTGFHPEDPQNEDHSGKTFKITTRETMHLLNTTCSWVIWTSFRSPNSRLQVTGFHPEDPQNYNERENASPDYNLFLSNPNFISQSKQQTPSDRFSSRGTQKMRTDQANHSKLQCCVQHFTLQAPCRARGGHETGTWNVPNIQMRNVFCGPCVAQQQQAEKCHIPLGWLGTLSSVSALISHGNNLSPC